MKARKLIVVLVAALLGLTAWQATRLGGEFIPRLSEGAVVINTIRIADISIDESVDYNTEIERLLLEAFPDEIRHVWSRIGTAEVATDPMGTELTDIFVSLHPRDEVDREAVARHGIAANQVLRFVESVGGRKVGEVYEGQRHFDLVARLPDGHRQDPTALAATVVPTEDGKRLPLQLLADVETTDGSSTITREWGRRLIRVPCNITGRDVSSFIAEARRRIAQEVDLPEGYIVEWGGQFENLERAQKRLFIVVPATLLLVFVLLFFSLRRMHDVLLIYTWFPFALIGGVFVFWLRDIPFSVSAAVGFIALFGIAVLNGQILIQAIRDFREEGFAVAEAVTEAAKQRLSPVLATALTDAAGFLPMALSAGVGAEVQRPLATVVIGGVLTSTLLTLFVLPALYRILAERQKGI
jgi:cobalt-zinc-cadmium resistance protein CzcA